MQTNEFVIELNKHQNILHKICYLYANDAADREDMFQEISLQAFKASNRFRGDAKFSTWLYRVALNTAIGWYKKEKKNKVTTYTSNVPETAENQDDIEEQVKAMYKAIANLSTIDKALVTLYLDNYSYQEMGDILGITANNVAVKMNRVKTKLKEEGKKYYQTS